MADCWGIEQVFHDVKENERIGQVQLRKVWANVGAFNLGLWVNSLVELWDWARGKTSLVDRSENPWDDAERRASYGDRRKALQQKLLDSEFQRCGVSGPGSRRIRKLFQAVVKLVAWILGFWQRTLGFWQSADTRVRMIFFIGQPEIGVIKIGTSRDPGRRVVQIRAEVHRGFIILGNMPGGKEEEKAIHHRFNQDRIFSE